MSNIEEKLKLTSRLVEHRAAILGEPQPEFPSLSVFYNTRTESYSAQIGSNYAGYFDQEAEVPVYLEKHFPSLEELLDWLILKLSPKD